MKRGDLYRLRRPTADPKPARVYVVVSRAALVDSLHSAVICAPIHSTQLGLATEVAVGVENGLLHPSAVRCDSLVSIHKAHLTDFVGALHEPQLALLRAALRIALDVE